MDIRYLKGAAARALDALPTAARVFDQGRKGRAGLNAASVGRRFTAAAARAGIDGVTAHSGRVGLASELTARGASTTETMLAGGWRSAAMVAHYSAGAVAKYL